MSPSIANCVPPLAFTTDLGGWLFIFSLAAFFCFASGRDWGRRSRRAPPITGFATL